MVNQILLGAFLLKQTDNNKPISRFWGKKTTNILIARLLHEVFDDAFLLPNRGRGA